MKKSAFPSLHTIDGNWDKEPNPEYRGISQRLYIATKILAGIISDSDYYKSDSDDALVREAYSLADELIKQDEDK